MEQWNSRRSPIVSTKGICASSQPLASAAGVKILQSGGNAADAAVAMAAALNVTEPCSTGIGGDAFALYYDSKTKKVTCFQGNGCSGENFTLELLNSRGIGVSTNGNQSMKPLDPRSGLCVTVPGAAGLWEDLVVHHGNLPLSEVLRPAIELANSGFPMSPVTTHQWNKSFLQGEEALSVFLPNQRQFMEGELFQNPKLANTFKLLAEKGAHDGFYTGPNAEAIVQAVEEFGGVLTLNDLEQHRTIMTEAISVVYKGVRVFQTPPPSHGISVLLTLKMLEALENDVIEQSNHKIDEETRKEMKDNHIDAKTLNSVYSADWKKRCDIDGLVRTLECMRRGYADALEFVSDPVFFDRVENATIDYQKIVNTLLSDEYIESRLSDININHVGEVSCGDLSPFLHGETVYFNVIDAEGNACSMINSNFMGFGTGISPKGTGYTLQNRGFNFSLVPGHLNVAGPRKRPYHTIIPGLATFDSDGSLYGVFGNMGGFMQPMGHVQLLRNLLDYHMTPQQAVDAPRWYLKGTGETQSSNDMSSNVIILEDGFFGPSDGDSQESGKCILW
jgi:gamma-glutamyltranspeptidase/glutathione hydrolase